MSERLGNPSQAALIQRPVTGAPDLDVRVRALLESLSDYAVFVLDVDGRVASWNPGAERINGYLAEEIVGRPFSVFYTPEDIDSGRPARELATAREVGRVVDEGVRVRKDGSRFWANDVLTALHDQDGALIGFGKVTRDESARRAAHEAVRASEERLRLMIEAVRDYAIFMLDPSGHVTSWNSGAQHLKGYTADEVIGSHFELFYSAEDRARKHPQEELAIAARVGRYEEEGWRIRKDGSRFWANVLITALREPSGTLVGYAKVTRDLTERRAAEQALRAANEDLERRVRERTAEFAAANREIEAFSYSVSHDLRAPLRSLDGFSRLVLERGRELDPELRDYLQRIRAASERMSELIDAMLGLARLTRAQLVRERVDVTALVSAIADELRSAEPSRRVELAVARGLSVDADPRLVRIVFENLLRNAWKFTRRNEVAHVEVGMADGELFVRDDGVGYPAERADKLFVPFQRLHRVKDFEGTGIGLATVQRIVLRHGGRIRSRGEIGRGAAFFFTLGPPERAHEA